MTKLKISILWTRMSGYLNACLKELLKETSDLVLVRQPVNQEEAPFKEENFSWFPRQFNVTTEFEKATKAIEEQNPDILIVAGWANQDYSRLARLYKIKPTFVVGTCDNPWHGNLRQKLASLTSDLHVKKYFDCIWVPGQKAAYFATKLKFNRSQIISGLYACDIEKFQGVFKTRQKIQEFPRNFLYVGRYVEFKGIRTLLHAYQIYRESCEQNHWQLWFSGSGPLEAVINSSQNVKNYGFTQPGKLPDLFGRAGVLVLPSYRENWGVVVHEATSAGLPIICTNVCGSSSELVKDNYNGCIVPAKNPYLLAKAIKDIAFKSEQELWELSANSHQVSFKYSPQIWVKNLLNAYEVYRNN